MRLAALLLLLASAASAGAQERADALLAKGAKALEAAQGAKGTKLLRALEAAKPHFRRALAVKGSEGAAGAAALAKAHATATARLVSILNAETAIYLERGALSTAKKRNEEALKLLPGDARAKALQTAIEDPAPYEFDLRVVDTVFGGSGRAERSAGRVEADKRIVARR